MSWTLFKRNVKSDYFLWLVILFILSFYMLSIASMFDPEKQNSLNDMMNLLPPGMMEALGFSTTGTTLLTFIMGFIYGTLIFMFPPLYPAISNNRLVARHVDRGSMAYLLSSPNSRIQIVFTQAVFSVVSTTALIVGITAIGILECQLLSPGQLEIGNFIMINIYLLFLFWTISGISFCASCLFNDTRHSTAVGVGLPYAFLLFKILGNTGEQMKWIGKMSLYNLFSPDKFLAGDDFVIYASIILVSLAFALYISGIMIFNKKDLPL